MKRRLAFAFMSAALVVSTLSIAEPAGAKKPVVTGRGHVACSMNGKVKYTTPLTPAGQDDSTSTIAGKLTCSIGDTGNAAVTIVSGKYKGTSPANYASCLSPSPSTFELTVKWKATGGKVVDSFVTLGPVFDQNSTVAKYRGGVVTGSFAEQTPEAQITWAKKCNANGLKNTLLTGSFDLDDPCASGRIRTEVGFTLDAANHIWFVVVPECPFTPATRPTGTIEWSYRDPSNGAYCDGFTAPLTSSGQGAAMTPRGLKFNDAPYWGVDTGMVFPDHLCQGVNAAFTQKYSGDSRYVAWQYVGWDV